MASFTRVERFFRNFGLTVFFTCLLFLLLEGGAFLILRAQGIDPYHYEFSQIVSGYHVFQNTPGRPLWNEVKEHPSDPPTHVDPNGFISNNPIITPKPEGVIRIFVMGGSAVFGVGQFPPFA